jgi:dTDP-4-amino-4,6-dideoxygalactose transaminase
MSNVLAGIGRGQMEVIDERVMKRREIFSFYKEQLGPIDGFEFLDEPGVEFFSNRWLTTVLIDPKKTGFTREYLQIELEKENIETRPLWKPMHLQPVFESYPSFVNGTSEYLFNRGLCLPSGSNMSDEDLERTIRAIKKCFARA